MIKRLHDTYFFEILRKRIKRFASAFIVCTAKLLNPLPNLCLTIILLYILNSLKFIIILAGSRFHCGLQLLSPGVLLKYVNKARALCDVGIFNWANAMDDPRPLMWLINLICRPIQNDCLHNVQRVHLEAQLN